MSNVYGSTVAKRRLARRLGELRVANGYTANQVCDKLSWGRGKVGRFEANTWKRPEMSDIRDLLRLYEVPEPERKELADLAVLARGRAWWREYADVFGDSEYPGYEADAQRIRLYMPLILPGLLQTPGYIEAQMRVGSQPTPWRRRAREARLRRQEILNRDDGGAPELCAVITEASLRYRWGVASERRDQLDYLIDVSRRPGVELRLLRNDDGLHPGMSSLISVFDFPGDEPTLVFLENDVAIQDVSDRKEVDAYVTTFERIREAALDADSTTEFLKQFVTTME